MKSLGIDRLGVDERLDLVEEIWDSIAADGALPTDAQRAELERRLAADDTNPEDVASWDAVKAAAMSRLLR